jgi:hypothetical protein
VKQFGAPCPYLFQRYKPEFINQNDQPQFASEMHKVDFREQK